MMMNPGIILSGQSPDILGQFARGQQIRQAERENTHTNSLRAMLQEQGPGIIQGDQNALAALARFDPQAALGVQSSRQNMDVQREQLSMARAQAGRAAAQHAAQMSAAERAREAETWGRAVSMLTQAQTPEAFAQVMQMPGAAEAAETMFGPGMATFENRNLLIAGALGVTEALGMGQSPQEPTSVQALRIRAQEGGLQPGTPEYQAFMARGGAAPDPTTVVNVGGGEARHGTIPPGFTLVQDPNSPAGYRMERIPGGPEDRSVTDANAARDRQASATIVLQDIDRALQLAETATLPTSGMGGSLVAAIPGTAASDISALLDTIGANIGFDALNAMRRASPTGGALGNVTERELALLQATAGSMRQSQSPEQFRRNLMRLRSQFSGIVGGEAPAGVSQSAWASMTGDQRAQMLSGATPAGAQDQRQQVPPPPPGINSDDWRLIWDAFTPEERARFR